MNIIGSDEVGYGAIAGPIYVVAVSMPEEWSLENLKDSKKYGAPAKARLRRREVFERLCPQIRGCWSLATRTAEEIDKMGVRPALVDCHTRAIELLQQYWRHARVIVDGDMELPRHLHAVSVVEADSKYQTVSAASVMAKVLRDMHMELLGEKYPVYSFGEHAGYGTPVHYEAISLHGFSPVHRRSYRWKASKYGDRPSDSSR